MIRKALPHEVDQLNRLAVRSKAYWPYDDKFLRDCEDDLLLDPIHIENGMTYVLEDGNRAIGYYAFSVTDDLPEMIALFVEPAFIGKGIGLKLWQHSVDFARKQGWQQFKVVADPFATEKFYLKVGCKQIGEYQSPVRIDRKLPLLEYQVVRGVDLSIRQLTPDSSKEIALVASRMRETLVDVLGEEKAAAMYSMDWLMQRVQWHLELKGDARIFLAETDQAEVIGQAIVRVETDKNDNNFGYFSTIYVTPQHRGLGVAKKLIQETERWCIAKELPYITYNTATNNQRLIHLYERFGFEIVLKESEMIQLKKNLMTS